MKQYANFSLQISLDGVDDDDEVDEVADHMASKIYRSFNVSVSQSVKRPVDQSTGKQSNYPF